MVKVLWSTTQNGNRAKDFMLMQGINESINQLGMANNVRSSVGEDRHVMKRGLGFEVKGQTKKRRSKT